MEKIIWDSEQFSVGHEDMDAQHSNIIRLINELIDSENGAPDRETFTFTLMQLSQYAVSHLDAEEQLLRDKGYADLESHISHHGLYKSGVAALSEEADRGDTTVVIAFLMEWWCNHILTEDMKYKPLFK